MTAMIRKFMTIVEDTLLEGRRVVPRPFRMVATVAVLDNPWPTTEFAQDLRTRILEYSPVLVRTLIPPTSEAVGGADSIEAFGKFGVVGVDGEVEHAAARHQGLMLAIAEIREHRQGAQHRGAVLVAGQLLPFGRWRRLMPLDCANREGERLAFAVNQIPDLLQQLAAQFQPGPIAAGLLPDLQFIADRAVQIGAQPHCRWWLREHLGMGPQQLQQQRHGTTGGEVVSQRQLKAI